MFQHSTFGAVDTHIAPGDLLVLYSDGITEAEDPAGRPFEESGLEHVIERSVDEAPGQLNMNVLKAVEQHTRSSRFGDDLTILVLKRAQSKI
jgi:sigma-B regulation protein RsbU (phosphoserine phosphatase)